MQQIGTVQVCFSQENDGPLMGQLVFIEDATGQVVFQGDPFQVLAGNCVTYGPVCVECEPAAVYGYGPAAERPTPLRSAVPGAVSAHAAASPKRPAAPPPRHK